MTLVYKFSRAHGRLTSLRPVPVGHHSPLGVLPILRCDREAVHFVSGGHFCILTAGNVITGVSAAVLLATVGVVGRMRSEIDFHRAACPNVDHYQSRQGCWKRCDLRGSHELVLETIIPGLFI